MVERKYEQTGIGQYLQEERIELRHAAAEATGLEDGSFDLVSICLVLHELPTRATEAIAREAFRLLRPGGTLGIMVRNMIAFAILRKAKS